MQPLDADDIYLRARTTTVAVTPKNASIPMTNAKTPFVALALPTTCPMYTAPNDCSSCQPSAAITAPGATSRTVNSLVVAMWNAR